MTRQSFDAIVIGAGQAGPSLAGRLAAAGRKVAIIERKFFGGTCVNTGCKPTKTMVASAYAARMAQRAAEYGVTLPGGYGIDMATVKARKDKVTLDSRRGIEDWLDNMAGCTVFRGHARFRSAAEIEVGDALLSAPQVFLNVGGRAVVPDMPGIDKVRYLTNTTLLELDRVPEHLVIVGGSYIGLEFAQIFRRFGSEVTVVEKGPRLISREDPDVSEAVREFLEAEGIRFRLNAECISFAPHGGRVGVGVNCTSGEPQELGTDVLLAVGRRPNTDDLGLEAAGVATDAKGYITVDDELRTSVPGIWALGDCNGRGAFTHTSYNDFEILAANLLDGEKRRLSDRISAYALYVDPPLGRVGMTEADARTSGRKCLVAKRPMTMVGRAVEKGETLGFMKVLTDADTGNVLGAAILGTGGDEVVHSIIDLMYSGGNARMMTHAMHIHPTVSELLPTLFGDLKPLA